MIDYNVRKQCFVYFIIYEHSCDVCVSCNLHKKGANEKKNNVSDK